MAGNLVGEIRERVAEVQALLEDHFAGGKHLAAHVVVNAHAVFSEPELLLAVLDVGYIPPNAPLSRAAIAPKWMSSIGHGTDEPAQRKRPRQSCGSS